MMKIKEQPQQRVLLDGWANGAWCVRKADAKRHG